MLLTGRMIINVWLRRFDVVCTMFVPPISVLVYSTEPAVVHTTCDPERVTELSKICCARSFTLYKSACANSIQTLTNFPSWSPSSPPYIPQYIVHTPFPNPPSFPSPPMQRPSLQNVRIRSTRDALQVFYAVARNVIPLITRRLDAEERRAIVPGNVYVWEERSANSEATGLGMERWSVPFLPLPTPLTFLLQDRRYGLGPQSSPRRASHVPPIPLPLI